MIILLHHFFCQSARTHDDTGKRIKQLTEKHNATSSRPAELQRILGGKYLWHNLTKQQEHKSKQHRDAYKLQPPGIESDGMIEKVTA